MSIGFDPTGISFSYSTFGKFKRDLARHVGFDIEAGRKTGQSEKALGDKPRDQLAPLFLCGDEGAFTIEETWDIHRRLKEVLPSLPPDSETREIGEALLRNFDAAIESGVHVEFI